MRNSDLHKNHPMTAPLMPQSIPEIEEVREILIRLQDNKLTYFGAEKALSHLIAKREVEARIDQLNQIRHSDIKLNHGTIELMGFMSQELNKQKLKLSNISKG